jgi:hypothetical protein
MGAIMAPTLDEQSHAPGSNEKMLLRFVHFGYLSVFRVGWFGAWTRRGMIGSGGRMTSRGCIDATPVL